MKKKINTLKFSFWQDTIIIPQQSQHLVYWISLLFHSLSRDPIAAKEPKVPVMSGFDQSPPGVDQWIVRGAYALMIKSDFISGRCN